MMLQYHPIEGAISVGSLPLGFTPLLESIQFHYATRILPTTEQSTHHIYQTQIILPELQEALYGLLHQPFWSELCSSGPYASSCHMVPMEEMNELYFSRPDYGRKRRYLYGTAANFEEHTDSAFRFPSARLYRVLIGLSERNNHTETYLPGWEKGVVLNRGDYLLFDFERTRHVVRRLPVSSFVPLRPRILIKFHFLVYDPSIYSSVSIAYLARFYVFYDYLTRWMIMIGTDPIAYYEYVMGWLIQLYIAPYVAHTLVLITFLSFLCLRCSSCSLGTSFFYSLGAPIVALFLLALGDWMTDSIH